MLNKRINVNILPMVAGVGVFLQYNHGLLQGGTIESLNIKLNRSQLIKLGIPNIPLQINAVDNIRITGVITCSISAWLVYCRLDKGSYPNIEAMISTCLLSEEPLDTSRLLTYVTHNMETMPADHTVCVGIRLSTLQSWGFDTIDIIQSIAMLAVEAKQLIHETSHNLMEWDDLFTDGVYTEEIIGKLTKNVRSPPTDRTLVCQIKRNKDTITLIVNPFLTQQKWITSLDIPNNSVAQSLNLVVGSTISITPRGGSILILNQADTKPDVLLVSRVT